MLKTLQMSQYYDASYGGVTFLRGSRLIDHSQYKNMKAVIATLATLLLRCLQGKKVTANHTRWGQSCAVQVRNNKQIKNKKPSNPCEGGHDSCQGQRRVWGVDTRQQFSFASPNLTVSLVHTICSDGYGNLLWNLQSDPAESYFQNCNTCVKLGHDVPRSTFTYLVEGFFAKEQSGLRSQVLSRYSGFLRKLQCSPSKEIRMLVRMVHNDPRSTTCKNIRYLKRMTGLDAPEKYSSLRIREVM